MGFFDELNTPVGDLIASATTQDYSNPDPGLYNFEVAGVTNQVGNKKDPNALAIIINYTLSDGPTQAEGQTRTHGEYLGIPQPADPRNPSQREAQQASFLKARFISLGIPEDRLNSVGPDDIEGLTGTLQIVKSKDGEHVNIRNLKVAEAAKAPVASPVKPVAARRAPARKPAPVEIPADEGGPVMDHAPEETPTPVAAPPKAKPATVVGNPFARN